ncbi:Lrp/AsnC family transcriptional regulator [Ancylobacter oerskovii]|uniref:Lrp/AsnC family transcriptional regulator n=1 Tax=Ancylobacter oerskovii TaxID=459519 RepID=A0ABW4YVY8_9HYPH|nr:Lrp/AsnC family transcriptional regulator [Ancylobacter oerskovii]MBS7544216.1 Lrp/AsnC family transcriptional regulator [Ancylobacter oerskovii]
MARKPLTHHALDAIDRKVLSILQVEGRITHNELAQRVGLPPTSMSDRIRQRQEAVGARGFARSWRSFKPEAARRRAAGGSTRLEAQGLPQVGLPQTARQIAGFMQVYVLPAAGWPGVAASLAAGASRARMSASRAVIWPQVGAPQTARQMAGFMQV